MREKVKFTKYQARLESNVPVPKILDIQEFMSSLYLLQLSLLPFTMRTDSSWQDRTNGQTINECNQVLKKGNVKYIFNSPDTVATLTTRLCCDSITPLGTPVVPLEKGSTATSLFRSTDTCTQRSHLEQIGPLNFLNFWSGDDLFVKFNPIWANLFQ